MTSMRGNRLGLLLLGLFLLALALKGFAPFAAEQFDQLDYPPVRRAHVRARPAENAVHQAERHGRVDRLEIPLDERFAQDREAARVQVRRAVAHARPASDARLLRVDGGFTKDQHPARPLRDR